MAYCFFLLLLLLNHCSRTNGSLAEHHAPTPQNDSLTLNSDPDLELWEAAAG